MYVHNQRQYPRRALGTADVETVHRVPVVEIGVLRHRDAVGQFLSLFELGVTLLHRARQLARDKLRKAHIHLICDGYAKMRIAPNFSSSYLKMCTVSGSPPTMSSGLERSGTAALSAAANAPIQSIGRGWR